MDMLANIPFVNCCSFFFFFFFFYVVHLLVQFLCHLMCAYDFGNSSNVRWWLFSSCMKDVAAEFISILSKACIHKVAARRPYFNMHDNR